MWTAVMLAAALMVVASPWYRPLQSIASAIGVVPAVLSCIEVALGLLAGTICGSFNMSTESETLLTYLGFLCVFGFLVSRAGRDKNKDSDGTA